MKKTNDFIGVEMVHAEDSIATRTYDYKIDRFTRLGREIKISPKANISINKPGFTTEFFVESVNVCIGIGNDHTADLIMTVDAWNALNNGEKVNITTVREFKEKYL